MSKVRYKPSKKGSKELLHCPAMMEGLEACVRDMKDAAYDMAGSGSGAIFTADVQPGKARPHAMVKTANDAAARANSENNVLLKALGGGSV